MPCYPQTGFWFPAKCKRIKGEGSSLNAVIHQDKWSRDTQLPSRSTLFHFPCIFEDMRAEKWSLLLLWHLEFALWLADYYFKNSLNFLIFNVFTCLGMIIYFLWDICENSWVNISKTLRMVYTCWHIGHTIKNCHLIVLLLLRAFNSYIFTLLCDSII